MIPSARYPLFDPAKGSLALFAPAGAPLSERLEAGMAGLRDLAPQAGLRVDDQVRARAGYFAGEDAERADHLMALARDDAVHGLLAARGGFGTSRILPLLDLDQLAATGKLFMGFSDLTCLWLSLASRGLVCVHGPVATQVPRLDEASQADLAAILSGRPPWPLELPGQSLNPGRARGPLMGGNLTMLCHLLATPYFPDLKGAILLIEDTSEAAYRVDRMLTQLELAGVLDSLAGVAVGGLGEGDDPQALHQAVARRLTPYSFPVVMGLPFGHGAANRSLPLGGQAVLDGDAGLLIAGVDFA